MQRVCAWCRKVLSGAPEQPQTHGVCPDCRANLIPVFLDTLDGPVLLLASDGRALSANEQARKAVGKDLPELREKLLGDVFDCLNAAMPGGCGNTPRCHGCALRESVRDTFRTGAEHLEVHSLLKKKTGENIHLTVATRRVKEGVLLTIKGQDRL